MSDKLPSQARVVIIGGGIAGCSTLYHLAELGWVDSVLVERDELTSGSTWHAAAQVTQFGGTQTMLALKQHSIKLYQKLAKDELHPFYHYITGGMRTAYTQDHIDIYQHHISMAKGMGIDMEFIDGAETLKRHPLLRGDDILGSWWDPLDGYVDPSGLTFALARHARAMGATVSRFNPVTNVTRLINGEFLVHTEKGDITCEKVVNAAGYRVNEVGAMLGVKHPVTSMEHMFFLTDNIAEIEALNHQVPIIRDPRDDFYSRQEKNGLLVGIYEQGCKTFGMDGIDPMFTQDLCPSDLDRCLDNMEGVFERIPCLTETGIHTVINGPITYTIDGLPLVGQIPGLNNAYCIIGLRAGIGEGGGHGKILAEIITHGQSEWDAWCLDPRRFTGWANTEQTCLKAIEDYQNEFHYHMPHEFRPAGRLARTTPLYPVLTQEKAVWGTVNGWERVLFYKPNDDFVDQPSFRFNDTKQVVAKEILHIQQHVGLMEVSGFNRYAINGEQAERFLDNLVCGNLPKTVGKVNLCYLLNHKGRLIAEATIAKLGENSYWYGSAAASEWHDLDWLNKNKPASVVITELTSAYTILVLAGPKARALLQQVSPRTNFSQQAFGWMQSKSIFIGHAEAIAMSVSFSGESAFELHIANEQLYLCYQLLREAGQSHKLGLFGLYATESMRLEKGYRHWKADLIDEHDPFEHGLQRFVNMDKADFIGKSALSDKALNQDEQQTSKQFAVIQVDCDIASAHGGASIYYDGQVVGSVTSGGYGFRIQKNLAYGFINSSILNSEAAQSLTIDIVGELCSARVIDECQYDPENNIPRGITNG